MKNTHRTLAGKPLPLGSTMTAQGINFALFARHADAVSLVIMVDDVPGPIEIPFDPAVNKTGDVWHMLVCGLPAPIRYG